MIGQFLSNTNESVIMSILQKNFETKQGHATGQRMLQPRGTYEDHS
jgi:hypothetical protein